MLGLRKGDAAESAGPERPFRRVLKDELDVIELRRKALDTERGAAASNDAAVSAPLERAWNARLLGLALSGGGIRSATLNLGVIQGLARVGLLRYVDYLSTVSGGGYIGSWLTALTQRRFAGSAGSQEKAAATAGGAQNVPTEEVLELSAQGFRRFEEQIAWTAGDGDKGRSAAGGGDGGGEDRSIRFLREFSNYLSPKLGLFSGDMWALIAIYVRNALLNQLVLLFALVAVLLAPRLLSALSESATPRNVAALTANGGTGWDDVTFVSWIAAVIALYLVICWRLGKNLAGVTRREAQQPMAVAPELDGSPAVILWIGIPLLLIGVTAASWLGPVDEWARGVFDRLWRLIASNEAVAPTPDAHEWAKWAFAAAAGSLISLLTWSLIALFAWLSRDPGQPWGAAEKQFWSRMVPYSLASGPVFGVAMHLAGASIFAGDTYAGYRLIAGPPVLAGAVLAAGVLHVGLAGKNFNSQYSEWLSRFGGMVVIGAITWISANALVLFSPLLLEASVGHLEEALASGWLLTTLASVVFGRQLAAASSSRLARAFMMVAPWIFIVGLVVALSASLQAGLHAGTTYWLTEAPDAERATETPAPTGSLMAAATEDTAAARGEAPAARAAAARNALEERIKRSSEQASVYGRIEIGGASVEIRGTVPGDGEAAALPGAAEAGAGGAGLPDGAEPSRDADRQLAELLEKYGAWLAATEDVRLVAIAMLLAAALVLLLSWRIDVNVFSLHGMYANRLARCYLGASVGERRAHPFSGMSARDDLCLRAVPREVGGTKLLVHAAPDEDLGQGDDTAAIYPGPYHLINTAINLVAGRNLAWQERKAASFLLSPLYCGFQQERSITEGRSVPLDSYRPSRHFSSKPRPLTLGEAVATSGAAASPNMGFRSTPAFAFLMGVFNIRLGRWVGNPHVRGGDTDNTWTNSSPWMALYHLACEVLGLTDSRSRFVYLSDGGHFENLGIYELVRRRCRYIIACDSGADEQYAFEDLANAIRKCRSDLGVEIELDVRPIMETDAAKCNQASCAVGRIRYSHEQIGTLLYIKSSRRVGLPSDVMHYAREHSAFPHETTADQFFSESQFESYRRLGYFLVQEIIGGERPTNPPQVDVDGLFRSLDQRWYPKSRSIAANFRALADAIDALFERLRTSEELTFLSRQFYPEWRSLLGDKQPSDELQVSDLVHVPTDEEQLRQGFYFCNSLIQLMENVYHELDLENEWAHPDNSGWLNVFNHWAWSGMFRVTWAVAAATYGRRFRAFCERRLQLDLGGVAAEPLTLREPLDLRDSGLNLHERWQVEEMLQGADLSQIELYRLDLIVRNPLESIATPLRTFSFGYALLKGNSLLMYRVQDHLRHMQLGRRGLSAVVGARRAEIDVSDLDFGRAAALLARIKEPAEAAMIADFRAMVVSVNEEWRDRASGA